MPLHPSLQPYDPQHFRPNDRLQLGGDGSIQSPGQQHRGNFIKRVVDFVTRTEQQRTANSDVARDLVEKIGKAYGREAERLAERSLDKHLSKGRPLTAYRVEQVLRQVEANATRLGVINGQILQRLGEGLMENTLREAFCMEDPRQSLCWPGEELTQKILEAVRRDPEFSGRDFEKGGDKAFERFFREVASRVIALETGEKLLPNLFALQGDNIRKMLAEGTPMREIVQSFIPQLMAGSETHEGLAAMHFMMQIHSQMEQLLTVNPGEVSPNDAKIFLGQIIKLNEALAPGDDLPGEGLLLRELGNLSEEGEKVRGALLKDIEILRGKFEEILAWKDLDKTGRQALEQVYLLTAELEFLRDEGKGPAILQSAPKVLQSLEDYLEVLAGMSRPENPVAARLLDDLIKDARQSVELLRTVREAAEAGVDLYEEGSLRLLLSFTRKELDLLLQHGLSLKDGAALQRAGLPIHPKTLELICHENEMRGEVEELGGGALYVPLKVDFEKNGKLSTMVFKEVLKELSIETEGGAGLLGIENSDGRVGARNIATKAMDDLLKFGLVPETGVGKIGDKWGLVMGFAQGRSPTHNFKEEVTDPDSIAQYRLQQEMARTIPQIAEGLKASGVIFRGEQVFMPARELVRMNFGHPELRRDLLRLQLLDALCGQGDRHGANYLLRFREDGSYEGLTGIDNDLSFGAGIHDPNELIGDVTLEINGRSYTGNRDLRGVALPEIVDRDMAKLFLEMKPEKVREELEGLLNEREIEATLGRLQVIQDHIRALPPENIIDPKDWGSDFATEKLSDPWRSYVGRELNDLKTSAYPVVDYFPK